MGLVIFSGFAELAVPPTTDRTRLIATIDSVTTGRGTAIGAAMLKGLDAIAEVEPGRPAGRRRRRTRACARRRASARTTTWRTSSCCSPTAGTRAGSSRSTPCRTRSSAGCASTRSASGRRTPPTAPARAPSSAATSSRAGRRRGSAAAAAAASAEAFLVADAPTLMEVAEQTGGSFHAAEDADQLREVFAELPRGGRHAEAGHRDHVDARGARRSPRGGGRRSVDALEPVPLAPERALEGREEPGRDPDVSEPRPKPLRLGLDRAHGVRADVLEELVRDLPVARAATIRRRRGRPTTRSGRRCRSSRRARRRAGRGTSRAPSSPSSSGRASAGALPMARAPWSSPRSSASTSPVAPARSTSTWGTAASAARASRAVQPVHQRMSVSVAGPNAWSQTPQELGLCVRRFDPLELGAEPVSARAPRVLAVRPTVLGRPRTSCTSAASSGRRRRPALAVDFPAGTCAEAELRREVRIGPRDVGRERLAQLRDHAERDAAPRRSRPPGSSATPLCATNPSSRFRSRAAIVRVHAASTTGASSRGTTQSVRRMPSMRTSVRSS